MNCYAQTQSTGLNAFENTHLEEAGGEVGQRVNLLAESESGKNVDSIVGSESGKNVDSIVGSESGKDVEYSDDSTSDRGADTLEDSRAPARVYVVRKKNKLKKLEEISEVGQSKCGEIIRFSQARVIDSNHITISCFINGWQKSDVVLLRPEKTEVAGVLQVDDVQSSQVTLKLLSVKSERFVQASDYFEKVDLSKDVPNFYGTSYLWKSKSLPEESRVLYRPLVTQGSTIGETAQTLWKNEYFFDALGTLGYGITDHFSIATNLAGWALGSPNGRVKGQVYSSENQTWSISLSSAQERSSAEKLFNIDLIWDSILSDKMIAHSLVSAAVISFNSAKDAAVLKSYGSSSIQTGYEYILNNWSRFLAGPSYNIDQKAIGGYLGYVKIINNLHLQASLTTNNVRELKISAKEGYFFILDAYWRW